MSVSSIPESVLSIEISLSWANHSPLFLMDDKSDMEGVEVEVKRDKLSVRPGYGGRKSGTKTFIVPDVLKGRGMFLARSLNPETSQAIEMPAGVCFQSHYLSYTC